MTVAGVGSRAVPPVPEEQPAESQPTASEASSSPMDVDSPPSSMYISIGSSDSSNG